MKKERIFKLIIVLIMGLALVLMSTNVFAAEGDENLYDFFEDQSGQLEEDTNTNTNTNTNTSTNTNTNTNTNTSTSTNTNTNTSTNTNSYNTNLPKAGVAENTIMGIAITVLGITAIYAYKKVNEYKNI